MCSTSSATLRARPQPRRTRGSRSAPARPTSSSARSTPTTRQMSSTSCRPTAYSRSAMTTSAASRPCSSPTRVPSALRSGHRSPRDLPAVSTPAASCPETKPSLSSGSPHGSSARWKRRGGRPDARRRPHVVRSGAAARTMAHGRPMAFPADHRDPRRRTLLPVEPLGRCPPVLNLLPPTVQPHHPRRCRSAMRQRDMPPGLRTPGRPSRVQTTPRGGGQVPQRRMCSGTDAAGVPASETRSGLSRLRALKLPHDQPGSLMFR